MIALFAGSGSVRFASELGCALDCDPLSGRNKYTGGPATDDTARINAFLATGTATRPAHLLLDGCALVRGIVLPPTGGVTIEGLDQRSSGFFMASGANNSVIRVGQALNIPADPGGTPPARGQNVRLRNLFVNGNRGTGYFLPPALPGASPSAGAVGNGNSSSFDARGPVTTLGAIWSGIDLIGIDDFSLENVTVFNSPCFSFRFSNCGRGSLSNLYAMPFPAGSTVYDSNTDGFHFSGPCNDIHGEGLWGNCGDDFIALNAYEGYRKAIQRVTLGNIHCVGSNSFVRLYTTGTLADCFVEDVTISRFVGSARYIGIELGYEGSPGAACPERETLNRILISDGVLKSPYMAFVQENLGSVSLRNIDWTVLDGGANTGFVTFGSHPTVSSSLSLSNCKAYRSTAGGSALTSAADFVSNFPGYGTPYAARVKHLQINGFAVHDSVDSSFSGAVPYLAKLHSSTTIDNLSVHSIDSSRIAGLTNGQGTVGRVIGGL